VVGAGLTGLVAAYRLAQAGWRVVVYERYPEAGGLVATFPLGGERLECFYHHLFTTDTDYLLLAGELGLAGDIEWLPSRMGIYSRGELWDFGTPASLLRFRPLSWPAKVRFALMTLYLRSRTKVTEFEPVTAHDWILRHAGRRVWDTVWGPLMRQKFAERSDDVSMAWLWRKVYLRGRSRSPTGLGESLGYMRGSFGKLVDVLVERLRDLGAELHFASPALRLAPSAGGVEVQTRRDTTPHEVVLFTAAPQELLAVAGAHLQADADPRLASLDAAGALCLVLELDRPLQRYYWLNVADADFPFGGVIEHTNYVAPQRYGGRHVVYLSKYLFADHPLWKAAGDEVWATYRPWLARINSAFDDSWVLARHHFKAAYAQPIVPCHYSGAIPPFDTPVPRLHHACMAQIYPEDRGQNYAVRSGEDAARRLLERYG
jgi:protoporphyrinogen oxidase